MKFTDRGAFIGMWRGATTYEATTTFTDEDGAQVTISNLTLLGLADLIDYEEKKHGSSAKKLLKRLWESHEQMLKDKEKKV